MIFLSMLPIGLIQVSASINTGLWYARSSEVMQTPLIQNLRWMRVIGDVVFAGGGLLFAAAVIDKVGIFSFNNSPIILEDGDEIKLEN